MRGAQLPGVRLVLKGFSDTLEHLLPFSVASLGWWLSVFTVVFAPGATLVLFRVTDPRTASDLDRPSLNENAAAARRLVGQGWRLAAVCLPVIGVLLWNLRYYSLGQSRISVLVPLWIVLFVVAAFITATAFSIAALLGRPWNDALRGAGLQAAGHLPAVLVISLIIWPTLLLGGLLVVPIFMFLPATVAAIVNRFVLSAHGIAVADPLSPTDERAVEEAIGRERRRFGP